MDELATPKNPFRAVKSYRRWTNAILTDMAHMSTFDSANTYVGIVRLVGIVDHVSGDCTYRINPVPNMIIADRVYVIDDILWILNGSSCVINRRFHNDTMSNSAGGYFDKDVVDVVVVVVVVVVSIMTATAAEAVYETSSSSASSAGG